MKSIMRLILAFALFGCAFAFYCDEPENNSECKEDSVNYSQSYWADSARGYALGEAADQEALFDRVAGADGDDSSVSISDAKDFLKYLLSVEEITSLAESALGYEVDWDGAVPIAYTFLANALWAHWGTDDFPPPPHNEITWDLEAFKKFLNFYVTVWVGDLGDLPELHFQAGVDDDPSTDGEPAWMGALITAVGGGSESDSELQQHIELNTYDHAYWMRTASAYTLTQPEDKNRLFNRIAGADGLDGLSLTDVKHFMTYLLSIQAIVDGVTTAVRAVGDYPSFVFNPETALLEAYDFIHNVAWPWYHREILGWPFFGDDSEFEGLTFDQEQFDKFISYYVNIWLDHGEDIGFEFQELHFQMETDDMPRDSEPMWLGALMTGINTTADDDCDSSCSCNFVGTGTELNVQFLCQGDNVCYNLVSGWCGEDETACEIPN